MALKTLATAKRVNRFVQVYLMWEYHYILFPPLEHPLSLPFQGQARTYLSTAGSQSTVLLGD